MWEGGLNVSCNSPGTYLYGFDDRGNKDCRPIWPCPKGKVYVGKKEDGTSDCRILPKLPEVGKFECSNAEEVLQGFDANGEPICRSVCSGGKVYKKATFSCECPVNTPYYYNNVCNQCPSGHHYYSESCHRCPSGHYYYSESCHRCPSNRRHYYSDRCNRCPEDQHWHSEQCITCPNGSQWNNIQGECECGELKIWNFTNNQCECAHGGLFLGGSDCACEEGKKHLLTEENGVQGFKCVDECPPNVAPVGNQCVCFDTLNYGRAYWRMISGVNVFDCHRCAPNQHQTGGTPNWPVISCSDPSE